MRILILILVLFSSASNAAPSAVQEALSQYQGPDGLTFSDERGKVFWHRKFESKDGKQRSCTTCHGESPSATGKHAKTGKKIDPMALSKNPTRFTKLKKIRKWFKRNCKWTLGRECTNQEKGDVLTYLTGQ